jgi:hypothetical protein
MTLSPKMLAVLQKVDAARAKLFAGLRASTERGAELEHALKAARKRPPPTIIRRGDAQTDAINALGNRREDAEKLMKRAKAQKKPPIKKPPLRGR